LNGASVKVRRSDETRTGAADETGTGTADETGTGAPDATGPRGADHTGGAAADETSSAASTANGGIVDGILPDRGGASESDPPERHESHGSVPLLFGLVLAGGESRRMGRDKGGLIVQGEPQVRRAWRLLNGLCVRAYISARAEQVDVEADAEAAAYRGLPLILDERRGIGPAAGLLAAWAAHPDVAWLVLATDMPLVDAGLVADLIRRRDPDRVATCFRQADGLLQPLCAIWEPRANALLAERIARGEASLRRLLESVPILEIDPAAPERLVSADTEESHRRLTSSPR
jgi:molybdopterin-guanine dinucleotide biosynthesis protein A